jgi:hypothetical protein
MNIKWLQSSAAERAKHLINNRSGYRKSLSKHEALFLKNKKDCPNNKNTDNSCPNYKSSYA